MELKSTSTRSGSWENAMVTVLPPDGKGTAAVPFAAQAGAEVAVAAGAAVAGAAVAGAGACVAGAAVAGAVAAGAQPASNILATITTLTRTNIIRFIALSSTIFL
jgi:hypothetical protein